MTKQKFAAFEIDGTLMRWQMFHSVVNELAARGKLGESTLADIHNERMKWKNRTDSDAFRSYEHNLVDVFNDAITQIDIADYDEVIGHVFESYKDQAYTYTKALIESLASKGYFLIAISGSNQEIIDKIAKHYGFDVAIGSKFGRMGGKLSGQSELVIDKKGEVLQGLIKSHDLSIKDSYAIGDSMSDVPMMELVSNPIVFNPDSNLLNEAKRRKWPIVLERKNAVYRLESRDDEYVLV